MEARARHLLLHQRRGRRIEMDPGYKGLTGVISAQSSDPGKKYSKAGPTVDEIPNKTTKMIFFYQHQR